MLNCKYCNKESKNKNSLGNHEFRCINNVNRDMTKISRKGIIGTPRTDAQKARQSEIARSTRFGGYRENAGRSKKFKVLDSFGKETVLQSTYELLCSEILNQLGVKWIRPRALKYNNKNYFSDFYLVDHDLYLDPKNSYKARLDAEKICIVQEQNGVKVVILLKEHLTLEYIARVIQ